MSAYYSLTADYLPVPLEDVYRWLAWHEDHEEQAWIGYDEWTSARGRRVVVSTRFFGTRNWLWETAVFVDGRVVGDVRHTSYPDALAAHGTTLLRCYYDYPRENVT